MKIRQPIRTSFQQVAANESDQRSMNESDILKKSTFPQFTRAVVKQVDLIGGALIEDKTNPKNSIRARILTEAFGVEDPIFYPMFSSHIMLPLEPEEEVWIFFENLTDRQQGYWISRVAELHGVDNVNHTPWNDKEKIKTVKSRTSNRAQKVSTDDIIYDESIITGIITPIQYDGQTEEELGITREIVPQYTKRGAGELTIQGSNNALITLTTDKTNKKNSGTIDVVTGRGRTDTTKPALNEKGNRDTINLNLAEGAPDFLTDAARIFVSMKTDPDDNFITSRQGNVNEKDVSTIIEKADTIRLIARSSVIIETQPAGNDAPPTSIVMKPNGEIIIHGKNIRIGSDKATTEHIILGDTLKGLLEELIAEINLIQVPTAVGPSGIPMNFAKFELISKKLDRALSANHFIEK